MIVNFEGTVSIQPTLIEALADVFDEDLPDGEEPPPDPGEEPAEPEGTVDEQVAALLAEASDLFDQADEALRRRRPGRATSELSDEARELVEQAEAAHRGVARHRGARHHDHHRGDLGLAADVRRWRPTRRARRRGRPAWCRASRSGR